MSEREALRAALQSIANSSCCSGCQEAARVAKAALLVAPPSAPPALGVQENPYIEAMRDMIAIARADFLRRVDPLLKDDKDRKLAESLAGAVGEVSAEQALEAFLAHSGASQPTTGG